jgi:hypothetical protein
MAKLKAGTAVHLKNKDGILTVGGETHINKRKYFEVYTFVTRDEIIVDEDVERIKEMEKKKK